MPLRRNNPRGSSLRWVMRRGSVLSGALRRRALSISELTAGSQVTRQAITKHLRLMERAGLAARQARTRKRLEVDRRNVEEARHYLDRIPRSGTTRWRDFSPFVE